ncbi:hypothetical protein GE118_03185 [Mycoplasma sp. NEAQ87857]|uniref:hypothetical protein n=1 Tax=Mycoplasma sp. NEAQ87857 TaxID=2683967 RepID=UPI00131739AB|nr:hypothetical protein [Mycoplasma sp. NEAQ87857]QGZ97793.1 hypothetical protein GE118_03185 [Mycoplasma sp. NEAQ87857]
MKLFSRDFEILRVNYVNGSYWNVPSILTTSRYKWVSKPYKSFEQLLIDSNNYNKLVWISLNQDPKFLRFNEINKIYNSNIRINFNENNLFNNNHDFLLFDNVYLRLTPNSLKKIQKGYLFIGDNLSLLKFIKTNIKDYSAESTYYLVYTKFDFDILDANENKIF